MAKSVREIFIAESSSREASEVSTSLEEFAKRLDGIECVPKDMAKIERAFMRVSEAVSKKAAEITEDEDQGLFVTKGLITAYKSGNRFVVTKDAKSGNHNYDSISGLTRNDLFNIKRCIDEILERDYQKSEGE